MGQLGPWFLMLQVLWTHIHFAANEVGGGRPLVRVWPEDLVRQVLRVQVVVQEHNRRTWEKIVFVLKKSRFRSRWSPLD